MDLSDSTLARYQPNSNDSSRRDVSGCLFLVIQLRGHTQRGSGKSSSGENDRSVRQGFGRLNVITPQYRESMGDRVRRGVLAEATNERTNNNYILEKCNYRSVYSIFVDVELFLLATGTVITDILLLC